MLFVIDELETKIKEFFFSSLKRNWKYISINKSNNLHKSKVNLNKKQKKNKKETYEIHSTYQSKLLKE